MLKIFDKISAQSLPRVLPQEIVCGTCGGNELLPVRTNITSDGRCAVCGGRSYVPASSLCEALARYLKDQRNEELSWTEIITKNEIS